MKKTIVFWSKPVLVVALILSIIVLAGCSKNTPTADFPKKPIYVLQLSKERGRHNLRTSEIVIIDAEKKKIFGKPIILRSGCLDISVGEDGKIYTAQSGGVGSDADNALGIVDPKSKKIDYAKLECPNPLTLEAIPGGKVYLTHGAFDFDDDGKCLGAPVSIVDTSSDNGVDMIHAPEIIQGKPLYRDGKLFFSIIGPEDKDSMFKKFMELDTKTDKMRTVLEMTPGMFDGQVVHPDGKIYGFLITKIGGEDSHIFDVDLVLVDPESRKMSTLLSFKDRIDNPYSMALKDEKLYIGDCNLVSDEYIGNKILVVDTKTNKVIETINDISTPASLLVVGDELWVTNYNDGKIVVIDTKTNKVIKEIKVGTWPSALACSQS